MKPNNDQLVAALVRARHHPEYLQQVLDDLKDAEGRAQKWEEAFHKLSCLFACIPPEEKKKAEDKLYAAGYLNIQEKNVPRVYFPPVSDTWSGRIKTTMDLHRSYSDCLPSIKQTNDLRQAALEMERLVAWLINSGYISVRRAAKVMGVFIDSISSKI